MEKQKEYAEKLARMIRMETISAEGAEEQGQEKFAAFRALLRELFPSLFGVCEYTEFRDAAALRWPGKDGSALPVLFMNHHDVVEASGKWTHGPFSGEIAEGRIWGRGTLDDKGGLWAMLEAGDELAEEGFVPRHDIWFVTSSTEETTGEGARKIVEWFEEKKIRFAMTFDEGGMILYEPIGGAKGYFAMIGVGEKGCADLKFIAASDGGHASTPKKNSPLVRLGKFMAHVDRGGIFQVKMNPTTAEMLRRIGPYMGKAGMLLGNPEKLSAVIERVVPRLSAAAAALFQTTVAFTMAGGSEGHNVMPREAWVIGNMRYSHHEGRDKSFAKIRKAAARYGVTMAVLDPGLPSRLTDHRGEAFRLTEKAVRAVFAGVEPVPYVMTGASDSRFFDRVSDQCIRFLPFTIDEQQLASIHGADENVNTDTLEKAAEFYRFLMREV